MLLLAGLTLLFGGATIASSRRMESEGGPSYAPQPIYAQPQGGYAPQPSYPGPTHGHQAYYVQDQPPPNNQVVLQSVEGGGFYANVRHADWVMHMHVDTGANICAVGDEVWSTIRRSVQVRGASSAIVAGDRRISTTRFVFPWLALVGPDGRNTVTIRDVEGSYVPGSKIGLLGMPFLRHCDVRMAGDQMVIRG